VVYTDTKAATKTIKPLQAIRVDELAEEAVWRFMLIVSAIMASENLAGRAKASSVRITAGHVVGPG
jgi:hypothetical protein